MQLESVFVVNGLSAQAAASLYRYRRDALRLSLTSPTLFAGVQFPLGSDQSFISVYHSFYQDPSFLYLTGLNQLGCFLLMDPKTQEDILFLPEKDAKKEFWEGFYLGYTPEGGSELCDLLCVDHVYANTTLFDAISTLFRNRKEEELGFLYYENGSDFLLDLKTKINGFLKKSCPHVRIKSVEALIWEQRLCLDHQQYLLLKEAHAKTARAFAKTLNSIQTCTLENEVAACLDAEIKRESWYGNSFPSIVASGENACVLHYNANNAPLKGLLLLDFGLRWHEVLTDISRTIPVSGVANPLQTLLLSIVLETQHCVEAKVKAGVSMVELDTLAWTTLNQLMDKHLLSKGGVWKKSYDVQPHRIGHAIGIAVHDGDPKRHYMKEGLRPNMLISNEPGVYGYFELTIGGKRYSECLGIRIEDNLWITDQGCENMSKDILGKPS